VKLFISWSQPRGRLVAEALRDWLPDVIQNVKPWMSAVDTERGARWRNSIAKELNDADVGIICLTPENQEAPWLLFEAGALSKKQEEARVYTYLFDMDGVRDPLAQFQHTMANEIGTKDLARSINKLMGDKGLESGRLEKALDRLWPELDRRLHEIPPTNEPRPPEPDASEMLREVLNYVRELARRAEKAEARESLAKLIGLNYEDALKFRGWINGPRWRTAQELADAERTSDEEPLPLVSPETEPPEQAR
jgi:hypothetical protein